MSIMFSATRTILVALALTAIGQQLLLHIGASYNALNFFSYFTNLSNLFAVFVLLLSVFGWPSKSAVSPAHGATRPPQAGVASVAGVL